ncbi:hypothetical protein OHA25_31315 [Nonomuraea sp. NBC_00507]|uniref:hypothetical protein n=1 Tax=Nonomuraea sp. NBC_00507 TaxID=2976002 RepID=UPI002E192EC5
MGSPIVTTAGLDVAPEPGRSQDAPGERGSRRARAVRISTVLAGLLHLAMAAVLAGIPGSSPTLDRVPVPEGYTTAPPPAALSARPAASPVLPTPDTAAPTALPVSGATPADGRGRTPPGGVPTGTVRPTPDRGAPVAVGATARGSKTAAHPGESVATRPGKTVAPAKTTAARGPTPAKTAPAKTPPSPPGKPSDTPADARPTPPGPTGEPPGRAGGSEGNPAGTDVMSGQAKK